MFRSDGGSTSLCEPDGLLLKLHDGSTLSFPWQSSSNLPYMPTTQMFEQMSRAEKEANLVIFERLADSFGIKVRTYLSDNHPFRSSEVAQDCLNLRQTQLFSGVGAHHQNRVERAGQTIFNWSRVMLLHYVLHWPQESRLDLWPYALDYAVWICNNYQTPPPDVPPSKCSPKLHSPITQKPLLNNHRHQNRHRIINVCRSCCLPCVSLLVMAA
jgi:hypothetical protein